MLFPRSVCDLFLDVIRELTSRAWGARVEPRLPV